MKKLEKKQSIFNITNELNKFSETNLTPEYIKTKIEDKLSFEDIGLRSREPIIVYLRHVYFKLCKELTKKTFREIAYVCGERDHSSAWHGMKEFDRIHDQGFFKDYYNFYLLLKEELLDEDSKKQQKKVSV